MKAVSNRARPIPTLIKGGVAVDDRGQLSFVNDFPFSGVKRFYIVEDFSTDTIRAFHGHMKEAKYAIVISGSAILAAVGLDDMSRPSKKNEVHRFVLSSRSPAVLCIPAGYANGVKGLEPGTKIMFLSSATLEESARDDFRFPYDYWGKSIWEVINR